MALVVTHKDTGADLTHDEWVAGDSHVVTGAYTDPDAVAAAKADADIADAITKKHTNEHKIVRKTSDQTVNNSSVFVNDSELKFSVAANEIWFLLIVLKLNTYTGVDWKATITVPDGAVANIRSSFPTSSIVNWSGAGDALTTVATADRTNGGAMVLGIYVGGANAGTVQLQWAQVNAFALNTKVLTNSVLIAHKIA
jgi:hypothetical protein